MRGEDIIKAVMREHLVLPEEFFGMSRLPRFAKARRTAIAEMADSGLSKAAIAKLMQRSWSTVAYHLDAGYRQRNHDRAARYYQKHSAEKRPYWHGERKEMQT